MIAAKRSIRAILLIVSLAFQGSNGIAQDNQQLSGQSGLSNGDQQRDDLIAESNASTAAVVALAVERFILNESRGEHWILTLQDADIQVRKYTDGRFTIVALPEDVTGVNAGLTRYVAAYNHMCIRAADRAIQTNGLDFAETTYRLILKHQPTSAYTNGLELRLKYIKEARASGHLDTLYTKVKTLDPTYDPFSFISEMGVQPAEKVPNLFSVEPNAPLKSSAPEGADRGRPATPDR